MASEEIFVEMDIEALIEMNKNSTRQKKSCWVVELEKELRKKVKTNGRRSPVVFSVPKAVLASYEEFYIPSLVSLGPYHFGRPEFNSMDSHKIEAVRRMQERIRGRSMHLIVEKEIVALDKRIRKFYDKELPYSAIDLAWMVTKDSCFIFEFILNYVRTRTGKQDFHDDCAVEGRYDAVLSSAPMNPTWKNILFDLALFENQIPLFVLERLLAIAYSYSVGPIKSSLTEINSSDESSESDESSDTSSCDSSCSITNEESRERRRLIQKRKRKEEKRGKKKILGDILSEIFKMSNIVVFRGCLARPYKKQKTLHYLEVLYCRHVGWDLAGYKQESYSVEDPRLLPFGWTMSIFTYCCPRWIRGRGVEDDVRPFKVKLPSAAELKKKGVHLRAIEHRQCIRWIRFDEKTCTLHLPEVRIDHFRYALLRNFIALEYSSVKYLPYPISSLAFFMDELVDTEEDIAVLREANIIKNSFGSNKEAADCFNALTMSYHMQSGCKPIDDARAGLHKYLRRKYKILWTEFISTYFGKPWSVVGSVAATLLLVMTFFQVFCLFVSCNHR